MPLRSTDVPLCDLHDVVMLDLDGVVYVGADAVDGAATALQTAVERGLRPAYLTNNASRPATVVADHLRRIGMPVPDDADVVTSAQAVARLMAADLAPGARVLAVGGPGLRESLESEGLVPVDGPDGEPVAVVQGFHPDIGWSDLAEVAYAVGRGLPWYASNRDLSIPTPRGTAPGNGSLVQAVANATGLEPVVAGKPERPLFDETVRRTGARRPLMVGDRIDTDIDGATALDIPSLAVLTGVSDLQEIAGLDPRRRPTYVATDLRGLVETHEHVAVDGDVARCGRAAARLDGDVIRLTDGDPAETASVRALLGLAWATRDTRGSDADLRLVDGLGG